MRIAPFVVCSVAVLSACASGPSALKKTAAADLGCPSKQLDLEQLDKSRAGSTWLVTGCGKTAQYSVVKKTVTRTSEIGAYTPPPPPAPPAPPSPEQQAQMQAFMDQHNQRMAQNKARRDEFFANSGPQQPPPPPARPAPADEPAPAAAAPVSSSSNYSGYVCLNGAYYACPDAESTMALGAYGSCKMKCMMGGSKCSSCVVGAGERCTRESSRDPECSKK